MRITHMPVVPQKPRQPAPPTPGPTPLAQGMPGQVAQNVVQQGPPPMPAPNAPLPGAQEPADNMNAPPPAPGDVQDPGLVGADPMIAGANPGAMPVQEPYGAQVLRRIHEDHCLLIQDYDEMASMCENPAIQGLLATMLPNIDGILTSIEATFAQEYSHLAPLEGGMPIDPMAAPPPAAAPPGDVPPEGAVPPEEGPAPDVDEEVVEADEANAVADEKDAEADEADAVAEEESAEADDAVKKKGPPKKGEKSMHWNKDVDGEMTDAVPADSGEPEMKTMPPHSQPLEGGSQLSEALHDHEKSHAKEAHGFLGELRGFDLEKSHFGSEHRMKSYHFHKMLSGIGSGAKCASGCGMKKLQNGGFTDAEGEGEKALPDVSPKKARQILHDGEVQGHPLTDKQRRAFGAVAGGKSLDDSETQYAVEMIHPHRAACASCGHFLERLSKQRHFGMRDRDEAGRHHDALSPLFEEQNQEENTDERSFEQPTNEEVGEPVTKEDEMEGQGDEGVMKSLSLTLTEQRKAMDQMMKDMASFAGVA